MWTKGKSTTREDVDRYRARQVHVDHGVDSGHQTIDNLILLSYGFHASNDLVTEERSRGEKSMERKSRFVGLGSL
jgi:hypothetical protein